MKDVYAALLLHSAGKPISEDNVSKVLGAAGVKEDAAKIKALVSALEGVNIDEAVKQAAVVATAAPVAGEAKKEDKKDEVSEEKKEEDAAAGLAALFG
ncbi:MAG: 50S ribosomal protein P1 [Candidatus Micrarchaeota archaeon]